MIYKKVLADPQATQVLPWTGGLRVFSPDAIYRLDHTPDEHGWYSWKVVGRKAVAEAQSDPLDDWPKLKAIGGYLVGRALVPDDVAAGRDLTTQAIDLHLIEDGLPRFCRVQAVTWYDGKLIYKGQDFGSGPEDEVQEAYEDHLESLDHVKDVHPALDLAFKLETLRRAEVEAARQRLIEEERAREEERRRLDAQARAEANRAERARVERERREQLTSNFDVRAREAMSRASAQLLDWQDYGDGRALVKYRFEGRRYECVCEMGSLRITDAGFCLNGHDGRFTLESLPSVLNWVIHEHGGLYVTRRV